MKRPITFTKPARKQLEALGAAERNRIIAFLEDRAALHPDPKALAKRLAGQDDLWRFRVGDFRIIFRFEEEQMSILVIAIGHRGEVYR